MRGLRVSHLIILGLLVASLLSCDDKDDQKCPVCPGDPSTVPTLDNVWPNADSTAWTYAITRRLWPDSTAPGIYPSAEDLPPAPTIDEIRSSLWAQDVGDSVDTVLGTYRLQFLGRVTTESGAEAQFLKDAVYSEADGSSPPPPYPGRSSTFFRHLATVRPDLRAALLAKGLIGPDGDDRTAQGRGPATPLDGFEALPFYLHGYAWEKTADYIGGYGDLNTLQSWKYLDRDLSPGHEFSLQLVPDLATDIYLRARILPRRSVVTEAGSFTNCVECAYLIDYGASEATDEQGVSLGFFRYWDFASIIYAPDFGPVMSYQRVPPMAPAGWMSAPERVSTDYWIRLVGTNVRARNP